jgi:hypothetical protein
MGHAGGGSRGEQEGEEVCSTMKAGAGESRLTRAWSARPGWLAPAAIVLISVILLHLAQRTMRLLAFDSLAEGYRFQIWTSNWTMQTLGLEDMAGFGPRALWYDHMYPPLLDAIRYLLMNVSGGMTEQGPPYIEVDFALYLLYAVCFGVVNAVVYLWVRDLTHSGWWALAGTVLWAVSPGYLTVMMLLEPSPLAVTFISVMFYLLYRFLRTRRLGYVTGFLLALLLASLTRNVTQVHVLAIVAVAVVAFWFMASRRAWWVMALNVVLLGLLFVMPIKQQVMFGTWDTSTQSGYHRAGMLWIDPRTVPDAQYPQHIVDNALTFSSRFNTQETLKDNYRLSAAANDLLLGDPVEAASRLGRSLTITVPEALMPTSSYTQNVMVDLLPWRAAYDWVFSGWRYLLLMLAVLGAIVWSRGWGGTGRLLRRYGWFIAFYGLIAAPVIWSNRYYPGREDEGPIWTEAVRLKIFLEIPFYVVLVYTVWLLVGRLRGRVTTVGGPAGEEGYVDDGHSGVRVSANVPPGEPDNR